MVMYYLDIIRYNLRPIKTQFIDWNFTGRLKYIKSFNGKVYSVKIFAEIIVKPTKFQLFVYNFTSIFWEPEDEIKWVRDIDFIFDYSDETVITVVDCHANS